MKIKSNKGITLLTTIITVILLVIISTFTLNGGMKLLEYSKFTAFQKNIEIIQKRVNIIADAALIGNNNYNNFGTTILELEQELQDKINEVFIVNNIEQENRQNYKYFNEQKLEEINIEGLKLEVLINFQDKKVISVNGITYNDNIYYSIQ